MADRSQDALQRFLDSIGDRRAARLLRRDMAADPQLRQEIERWRRLSAAVNEDVQLTEAAAALPPVAGLLDAAQAAAALGNAGSAGSAGAAAAGAGSGAAASGTIGPLVVVAIVAGTVAVGTLSAGMLGERLDGSREPVQATESAQGASRSTLSSSRPTAITRSRQSSADPSDGDERLMPGLGDATAAPRIALAMTPDAVGPSILALASAEPPVATQLTPFPTAGGSVTPGGTEGGRATHTPVSDPRGGSRNTATSAPTDPPTSVPETAEPSLTPPPSVEPTSTPTSPIAPTPVTPVATATDDPPPIADPGITGVVGWSDGRSIAGLDITLWAHRDDGSETLSYATVLDSRGAYTWTLRSGVWWIRLDPNDARPAWADGAGGAASPIGRTPVTVGPSGLTTGISATLAPLPSGMSRGSVLRASGAAAENVLVSARADGTGPWLSALTGPDGVFELPLALGAYSFGVSDSLEGAPSLWVATDGSLGTSPTVLDLSDLGELTLRLR